MAFGSVNISRLLVEVRATFSLGVPIVIALIAQTAMSITDLILMGRLGLDQVAGVSLGLTVYIPLMLFALGIVTAISPRISQAYGAQELATVRHIAKQGCWVALAVSIPAFVTLMFTEPLLVFLGQDRELASIAGEYNKGSAIGLPAFILYINFRCVLTNVGQPKPTTVVMLTAVPLNAVIGYFLIFGGPGIEGQGVFGAGVASSLVRLGVTAAVIFIVVHKESLRSLNLFHGSWRPDCHMFCSIFAMGLPIACRIVLAEGMLSMLALIIGPMGAGPLVAHTIASRLLSLTLVVALGFSGAAATRVWWGVGKGDLKDARVAGFAAVGITIAVTLIASIALFLLPREISQILFSVTDAVTLDLLENLLPIVAIYQIINGAQIVLIGALLGLSDVFIPTFLVLSCTWGLGLGIGLLLALGFGFGVLGLWAGLTFGVAALLLMACIRFIRKTG